MSTHTADSIPGSATGQPAKDSGCGMIVGDVEAWKAIRRAWLWVLDGRRGHMPIPPDDYARHWELEGPHA